MCDAALHMPLKVFDRADFIEATDASADVMAGMDTFLATLTDWNARMNLVGPSALAEFWGRHAYDSAQLLNEAPDARVWADLGAGAGFPGIVLAIFLKDREGAKVHLIESMAKRCAFLRSVSIELGLPTLIHNSRAESLHLSPVDVVTARALAPMPRLLEYAHPLLRGSTVGLFLKGRDVERELEDARKSWRFEVSLSPSASDPEGRIVSLKRLSRVTSRPSD
jgi:16S rRNA (guanine527-N7)-methyltransferase